MYDLLRLIMNDILELFFSPRGRLGRFEYFLYSIVTIAALFVTTEVFKSLPYQYLPNIQEIRYFLRYTIYAICLIPVVSFFMLSIRRLRDIGHSFGWTVLLIPPFISLMFYIYLLIVKGTSQRLYPQA